MKRLKRYLVMLLAVIMLLDSTLTVCAAGPEMAAPAGQTDVTVAKGTETTPGTDETAPGTEETTPGTGETTPGTGETTPGTGETTPGTGETTPGTGETTPGTEETTPGTGETTPGTGETIPGTGETIPGTGETIPGTGETTPGTGETTLGTGETTPGTGETTPGTDEAEPGTEAPEESKTVIAGFTPLETTAILLTEKPELTQLLETFPASLEARLSDSEECIAVPVEWGCTSDYEEELSTYLFAAKLTDESVSLAEGVSLPEITVTIERAEKKVITGFLSLPEETSAMELAEKPLLQELLTAMPDQLSAVIEGQEEAQEVPVTWECDVDYEQTEATEYQFTAKLDPEGYQIGTDVMMPVIQVSVKTGKIKILSFADLTEEESNLYLDQKVSLEELLKLLPEELDAVVEGKEGEEEAKIQVSWECENDYETETLEEYVFEPVFDEENYVAGEMLLTPVILVSMGETFSDVVVNPMYESLVTPDLLAQEVTIEEEADGSQYQTYDVGYANAQSLGAYIKKVMLSRNTSTVTTAITYYSSSAANARKEMEDAILYYATQDSPTGAVKEGDYLAATLLGYAASGKYRYDSSKGKYCFSLQIQLIFMTTPQQENFITGRINSILSGMKLSGKSDIQKLLIIYDWICDNVDYVPSSIYDPDREDVTTESGKAKRIYHTAYSALSEGYTVCQGYAALFYRMCKQSGIKVRYATSTNHAWNIVRFGSRWYNMDTTWDGQDGITRHDWFMKNMGDFPNHPRETLCVRKLPTASYPMSAASYGSGEKMASVTSLNSATISVKWKKMEGVSGYIVYRSTTSKTAGFSPIATITGGGILSYTDRNLTCGAPYYYKVRPYIINPNTNKKVELDYSNVLGGKPSVGTTTIKSVIAAGYNSLKVTWTPVTGASGYTLMRSTSATGTYSRVRSLTGASNVTYTDSSLVCGVRYYYKVLPYKVVNGKNVYGVYSAVKNGITSMGQAVLTSVTCSSYNSNLVQWKTVPGAQGYVVYRCTDGKSFAKIASVNGNAVTSYTDKSGLVCGKTYYYRVRAFLRDSGKIISGPFSKSRSRVVIPGLAGIYSITTGGKGAILLKWKAVAGATGFEVWRSTKTNGTYSLVRGGLPGSTLSYKNTGLKVGQTYYYKVRSYRIVSGKKVYGNYSRPVSFRAK